MKQEKRKTPKSGNKPKRPRVEADGTDLPAWTDHNGLATASMLHGQSLLFTGQGIIQVLTGSLEVDGFTLTSDHEPLPLSTGPPGGLAIVLTAKASSPQVPRASHEIIKFSVHSPSVANEQEHEGHTGASSPRCAFQLHHTSGVQPSHSAEDATPATVQIPTDWAQTLDTVVGAAAAHTQGQAPPVSVVVVGPKGVGKSSLSRLLVNHLLNCCPVVAYLDTDCGQCEVTPSGMVSLTLLTQPLLGPACTHVQQTSFAHYIGDTSPQSDPGKYSDALASILAWYTSDALTGAVQAAMHQTRRGNHGVPPQATQAGVTWPPLVINTHGWVKGLGLDLVSQLINTVGPTHVVQVRSRHERRNPPPGAFWWAGQPDTCPTHVMTISSPAHIQQQTAGDAAGSGEGPLNRVSSLPQIRADPGPNSNDRSNKPAGAAGLLGKRGTADAPSKSVDTGSRGGTLGANSEGGGEASDVAGLLVEEEASGAVSAMTAVESRALQWHAWAKAACGLNPMWGAYDTSDLYASAVKLCRALPFTLDLADVQLDFMHTEAPPAHLLPAALNGVVVGLASSPPSPPLAGQQPALPICHGIGLVRSVDVDAQKLYILTPVAEELLDHVDLLMVGKAAGDLPLSFLQAGSLSAVSPYMTMFSLGGVSGAAAGASTAKARRNLGRSRLGNA